MVQKALRSCSLLAGLSIVAGLAAHTRAATFNAATLARVSGHIINHHYQAAETLIDSLRQANPEGTIAHLQAVVLYDTWIEDYGIVDSLGNLLVTAIEKTIAYAERDIRQNPHDAYAHFSRGSALAYRSLYNSYVKGVRITTVPGLLTDAIRGVNELKRARDLDSTCAEPLIGIGQYLHWKAETLPWLPGTDRDRADGIAMLEEATRRGTMFNGGAAQTLGWVYIREKRYDDAIALVQPLVEAHPQCRFFRDIVARAYLHKGEHDTARAGFQAILDGLSVKERANNFLVMKYMRWLAWIEMGEGHDEAACRIAQHLYGLDYTGVHLDWMRRKFSRVEEVMQKTCPESTW